jgi:hypothetical protein
LGHIIVQIAGKRLFLCAICSPVQPENVVLRIFFNTAELPNRTLQYLLCGVAEFTVPKAETRLLKEESDWVNRCAKFETFAIALIDQRSSKRIIACQQQLLERIHPRRKLATIQNRILA